jgi:phosphoglycerate dehydrogenase-like enzyme
VRIWCNYNFHESLARELRARTTAHQLTFVSSSVAAPAPDSAAPDILLGQPEVTYLLTHLPRWVEITSAGYSRYDRDDMREAFRASNAFLTNASGVFDEACAQHLLSMILALARELPRCLDNQRAGRHWLHDEPRLGRRPLLNGQRVIIYGFGAIGRRVVQLLHPLGMELVGVRRTVRGDEGIHIVTPNAADSYLAAADHVVDLLPASPATRHFFNADRFAGCKPGAHFYNIGRGTTVDQPDLIAALEQGHLGAAYLDVTDPEPLPPGHPLWDAPNCFITPHIAGTHDNEQARLLEHFLANLRAFEKSDPLRDRIV